MSNVAGQIDSYLKDYGSPMAGLGSVYVAAGKKYGVDPRLVVAISGAESSFGKHLFGSYNAWGWGPGKPFASWEQGISTVTQGLARYYIAEGRTTPAAIASKYAPASDGNNEEHWSGLVSDFMRALGASPSTTTAKKVVTPAVTGSISAPKATAQPQSPTDLSAILEQLGQPSVAGVQSALLTNLGDISRYGHPTSGSLSNVLSGALQDRATDESNQSLAAALRGTQASTQAATTEPATPVTPPSTPSTSSTSTSTVPDRAPGNDDLSKWVKLTPGADRQGTPTQTNVLQFVARVAQGAGEPLTIGTGSNHKQFSDDKHTRVSAHWAGRAADIPADGEELTRLGRLALIAAGMPEEQAMKQTGGLFNVGGWQVIFNVDLGAQGGNHFNHLHVGFRG